MEDIRRRLFNWTASPAAVYTHTAQHGLRRVPNKVGVVASNTGEELGIHHDQYLIHQYHEWLLDKVGLLFDGGLAPGSAGLLKNRAQAWVSVEVPDTVHTPEGVRFRPHLLAVSSHDGSLKTTYKRTVTNVVCDNTMGAALAGAGQVIKIKHTSQSQLNVATAREALNIVHVLAEDYTALVRQLCQVDVSDRAWNEFLRAHVPDNATSKRAQTNVATKRSALRTLWDSDERVSPWRNTAWGVVQAVNTHEHHNAVVHGASRPERNLTRSVTAWSDNLDTRTIATLDTVLSATGDRILAAA